MTQPSKPLSISVAMDTHIGQHREQNQDAIGQLVPTDPEVLAQLGQIFVVADGVGGLTGGDLASQYAVSTVISSYYEQESGTPPDRLARAIAEANSFIYEEGQEQDPPVIMATTIVAAVVRGSELVVGSVGDSPAYLLRDATPRQLTQDHTVAAMAEAAHQPLPDDKDADRKLVRAVGSMPSVKVDIITGRVRSGDHVVLCSDGLTIYVPPAEIDEIVASHTIDQAAERLIDLANERGGIDNISVIVLRLTDALTDDHLIQLPRIPDPMEAWGRPRSTERSTERDAISSPPSQADQPDARPTVRRSAPSPTTKSSPSTKRRTDHKPRRDIGAILHGNTVLAGLGIAVLLVIFVVIMIVIAGDNGDDADSQAQYDQQTATQAVIETATATIFQVATQNAQAVQTEEALLAATSAQAARLTLTPPTPYPTSGPQLANTTWFRVLPGDPLPTYQEPDIRAEAATPLEEEGNYRVTRITPDGERGPWYQVVDNLGREVRWINAPSLHQRIVVIDEAGNPLPAEAQPLDLPPPDFPTLAPTAIPTRTPTGTVSLSPSPPGTGTPGDTATPTPTSLSIPYGVENWEIGDMVAMLAELDLCRVPDVNACDVGIVSAAETGTIIDGPFPSGEHWWWEIEFDDGRTGWVAQVLLGPAQ